MPLPPHLQWFSDIPIAIEPVYATTQVNESVLLYTGKMELEQPSSSSFVGCGEVRFEWLPVPRLRFEFTQTTGRGLFRIEKSSLRLIDIDCIIDVVVLGASFGSESTPKVAKGYISEIETGNGESLSYLVFHVPNFHDLRGAGIRLSEGGG